MTPTAESLSNREYKDTSNKSLELTNSPACDSSLVLHFLPFSETGNTVINNRNCGSRDKDGKEGSGHLTINMLHADENMLFFSILMVITQH